MAAQIRNLEIHGHPDDLKAAQNIKERLRVLIKLVDWNDGGYGFENFE